MFQDALDEIRDSLPGATQHQKKVGKFLYDNPDVLGELTLVELAEKIGTSAPTVIRFCQNLGYGGFVDFTRAMQCLKNNEISHATFFHNARVRNGRINQHGQMARMLLEKERANLDSLIENYPAEKIAECVALMEKSSSISVLGQMSAYPAAIYFEQLLTKITPRLASMSGSGVTQAATISRMDKDSVLFCIAFPRYPKAVLELAREAARKKATLIAITDSESSSLAEIAKIFFTVDVGIFSYIDLLGAAFSLINAICMEFSLALGIPAEQSLSKYDRVVSGTYLVPGSKSEADKAQRPEGKPDCQ